MAGSEKQYCSRIANFGTFNENKKDSCRPKNTKKIVAIVLTSKLDFTNFCLSFLSIKHKTKILFMIKDSNYIEVKMYIF